MGRPYNDKGRETPVADAATLVEIAWLGPGTAAVQFRRKGAESVCRMLGGDLTLVDEIQRRHTQLAGTTEEEFLLADVQRSPQQVTWHKRTLKDDDEVYTARKQQILKQLKHECQHRAYDDQATCTGIHEHFGHVVSRQCITNNHAIAADHQAQRHCAPGQHD